MKKLLVIGAGFLQDFVIKKAKSMGYYTLAVDADKNAVGFKSADEYEVINIVDEEACLQYALRKEIDGVITAASDYGVLTTSYIAEKMNLPGLRYDVAKVIKNKYLVEKCLFENKVDDTRISYEIDATSNLEDISAKLEYPVMVKPCDGSGSRGASRVDDKSGLDQACNIAINQSKVKRAVIETFITGQEYGAETLVADGEVHVMAVMKKWMTKPPYYAELGHAVPSGLSTEMEAKVIKCVKDAVKALGINFGSVNMDLLITEDNKVFIVDIGARMGGNMIGPCIIPYGTGIDYMGNMIKNVMGDPLDWTAKEHSAVASRLLAFDDGVIKTMPDIAKVEEDNHVEIYHHMELGDVVNEYHTNLDGMGYIIAKDETVSKAEEKAVTVLNYFKNTLF